MRGKENMPLIVIWIISLSMCLSVAFAYQMPKNVPLSEQEWTMCEQFFKTHARSYFSKQKYYIAPGPGHPCPIEKDPKTGKVFFHLAGRDGAFIGQGRYKRVSKSILYGEHPKVVARCQGTCSFRAEEKVLRKLHKFPAIVHMKACIRKKGKRRDIYLEYYEAGSVQDIVFGRVVVDEKDLLQIMKDTFVGLKNLHSLGYFHRDIHAGNILLHRKGGHLRAALTDFGLTLKISTHPASRISVQDFLAAPEVLIKSLKKVDRPRAEDYCVGVIFHDILFHQRPVWSDQVNFDEIPKLSQKSRADKYQYVWSKYWEMRNTPRQLSPRAWDLANLVYDLLKPSPEERPSTDEMLKRIDSLAHHWSVHLE
jgi:serine/threonine protein kinase